MEYQWLAKDFQSASDTMIVGIPFLLFDTETIPLYLHYQAQFYISFRKLYPAAGL
jgi:hypothetical protein